MAVCVENNFIRVMYGWNERVHSKAKFYFHASIHV